MLQLFQAKTKRVWGPIIEEDFAFFLNADVGAAGAKCYSYYSKVYERSDKKSILIGHGELIFYKKTYANTQLHRLLDQFVNENRVGAPARKVR